MAFLPSAAFTTGNGAIFRIGCLAHQAFIISPVEWDQNMIERAGHLSYMGQPVKAAAVISCADGNDNVVAVQLGTPEGPAKQLIQSNMMLATAMLGEQLRLAFKEWRESKPNQFDAMNESAKIQVEQPENFHG